MNLYIIMKSLNVLYYVIQVISVANDSVYPLPRNQYVKEARAFMDLPFL